MERSESGNEYSNGVMDSDGSNGEGETMNRDVFFDRDKEPDRNEQPATVPAHTASEQQMWNESPGLRDIFPKDRKVRSCTVIPKGGRLKD